MFEQMKLLWALKLPVLNLSISGVMPKRLRLGFDELLSVVRKKIIRKLLRRVANWSRDVRGTFTARKLFAWTYEKPH